jgi:hypothetical protein
MAFNQYFLFTEEKYKEMIKLASWVFNKFGRIKREKWTECEPN